MAGTVALYLIWIGRFLRNLRLVERWVQGTRYKVQGTRYKVQGTRYKVQGTRYKVQGSRSDPKQFLGGTSTQYFR
jgi:hypothetical protein